MMEAQFVMKRENLRGTEMHALYLNAQMPTDPHSNVLSQRTNAVVVGASRLGEGQEWKGAELLPALRL